MAELEYGSGSHSTGHMRTGIVMLESGVGVTLYAAKTCAVIADSLPTDLAMEARVECAAILSKDHVCCSCRNTAAKCICLNCGDTYCGTCATFHQNMASSRHHKVEDLSSMTAERLATTRQLPCSVHADKTSEIYCPTHGAAICHLCATTKHRACPEVTELDDKMEEARKVLAELAATLKAGESRLEREINELDRCLQDMEKATQATLTDIDQKCDRLQSRVEACRQRLKKLAKGAIAEAKDSVQKKKSRLQGQRGKVTSHHRLVDDTSQALSRACLLGDSASMLKKRVSDLDLNLNSANSGDIVTMAKLNIDNEDENEYEK
nr:hypothetical protein BaRGS_010603 [Batillaria attramentaria]